MRFDNNVVPLSDFAWRRLLTRGFGAKSDFVFPGSGTDSFVYTLNKSRLTVARRSGVRFQLPDLRRTFIAAAEDLEVKDKDIDRLILRKPEPGRTPERLRRAAQKITSALLRNAFPRGLSDG